MDLKREGKRENRGQRHAQDQNHKAHDDDHLVLPISRVSRAFVALRAALVVFRAVLNVARWSTWQSPVKMAD